MLGDLDVLTPLYKRVEAHLQKTLACRLRAYLLAASAPILSTLFP